MNLQVQGHRSSMASSKLLHSHARPLSPLSPLSPASLYSRRKLIRVSLVDNDLSAPRILSNFNNNTEGKLFLSTVSTHPTIPIISTEQSRPGRSVAVKSQFSNPLISPKDNWGIWTFLFASGAFGIWSDKTKIGSTISGCVVSILLGLAGSSLGIVPSDAPAYAVVMDFLLPLIIPLMLFKADLLRVVKSTGTLLLAFLLGSVATTIGTAVAYFLVPMRSLGQDGWKVAAALMGRHIGGAVNYVAVGDALGLSPSVLAAGIAADNVLNAVYFAALFALASKVKAETSTSADGVEADEEFEVGSKIPVLQMGISVAISFAVCKIATTLTNFFGIQGGNLPVITAISVILATVMPKQFAHLEASGQAMALILMQVFLTAVGASGSIWNIINTAPSIFIFDLIQIVVHLLVIIGVGKLLRFDYKELLIASNANIGGPNTACGMATAKGWNSLIVPGILVGIFGIAAATFLSIAFAVTVLKFM